MSMFLENGEIAVRYFHLKIHCLFPSKLKFCQEAPLVFDNAGWSYIYGKYTCILNKVRRHKNLLQSTEAFYLISCRIKFKRKLDKLHVVNRDIFVYFFRKTRKYTREIGMDFIIVTMTDSKLQCTSQIVPLRRYTFKESKCTILFLCKGYVVQLCKQEFINIEWQKK